MFFSLSLLLTSCAPFFASARVNVVLVGATGNLAKKYLFQAFSDQIIEDPSIYLIPAATKKPEDGQKIVDASIAAGVKCKPVDGVNVTAAECEERKKKFAANTWDYIKLRNEEDWKNLGERLQADMEAKNEKETGRLVYLSIPPRYFGASSNYINKYLRPAERVVTQKPIPKGSLSTRSPDDTTAYTTPEPGAVTPDPDADPETTADPDADPETTDDTTAAAADDTPAAAKADDTPAAAKPEGPWLRVVFEKPFGKDTESALKLAEKLTENLNEEEILRVDHYLGKAGVRAITDLHKSNPNLREHLNGDKILRVEVGMYEREDCEGRTRFYNEYGVARDVMQNHLTEMATLAAMDVPPHYGDTYEDPDSGETYLQKFQRLKRETLEKLVPPVADNTFIAQYDGYEQHVLDDLYENEKEGHQPPNTPTFGFTFVGFDTERWKGVPFVITAGKKLAERKAFVRYIFQKEGYPDKKGEVLEIQVQGESFRSTQITLTGGKIPLNNIEGWDDDGIDEDGMSTFHLVKQNNAYWEVVDKALKGDRTMFVDTGNLMLSWKAWTPVLHAMDAGQVNIFKGYGPEKAYTGDHLIDIDYILEKVFPEEEDMKYDPDNAYDTEHSEL